MFLVLLSGCAGGLSEEQARKDMAALEQMLTFVRASQKTADEGLRLVQSLSDRGETNLLGQKILKVTPEEKSQLNSKINEMERCQVEASCRMAEIKPVVERLTYHAPAEPLLEEFRVECEKARLKWEAVVKVAERRER